MLHPVYIAFQLLSSTLVQLHEVRLFFGALVCSDDAPIEGFALPHDLSNRLAVHLHLLAQLLDLADKVLGVTLQHGPREFKFMPLVIIHGLPPLELVMDDDERHELELSRAV